ncbi:hypothetical protein ABGT22_25375 [Peribacillus frigoritolerans]|uniref:hypothetical protein n=1 Tax=Peribacillus frigoritolerans TaxID=450367 RepID=UPI00345D99B0
MLRRMLITLFLGIGVLTGCGDSEYVGDQYIPADGEKVVLDGFVVMAKDKETLEEAMDYVREKNSDAFNQLVANGSLIELEKNDIVTVKEFDGSDYTEIMTEDGKYGFILSSMLGKVE